jgi:hypothetical protein
MIKIIKNYARNIPFLKNLVASIKTCYQKLTFSSADYWNSRYINGGTSGAGSYEHLAEFKADILNSFVAKKKIKSVIEFGFGDGNQLMLATYPDYTGYDVSQKAVEICRNKFFGDAKKTFHLVSEWRGETAELVLSLDVIYHLIEDSVFENYMQNLFLASDRYVVIYASDTDENDDNKSIHVRHRKFTRWVANKILEWYLIDYIPNQYPIEEYGEKGTFANFYIYEKA